MAHYDLQQYALSEKDGYLTLFKNVNKVLQNDDITIGNLETVVCDDQPIEGFPEFNAKASLLDAIKQSGIEVLTIANNHLIDHGIKGIRDTIEEIEKRDLIYTGGALSVDRAKSAVIIENNGIRIGLLSATWTTNIIQKYIKEDKPYIYRVPMDDEKALEDFYNRIKKAKEDVEILIVSYHAGKEYVSQPVEQKKKILENFAEYGADIVLSHHPHVLQPINYYITEDNRNTLIAYSLGNFVSAQARYISGLKYGKNRMFDSVLSKTAEGVILQFDIKKINERCFVDNAGIIPIFNICFTKEIEDNKQKGFIITFIETILSDKVESDYEIANFSEIKELVSYRLKKIKELIRLPVISP